MEVSALKHTGVAGIHGRSPLLRLQSDEKLIALIRRSNHHAFEALMSRYQSRLLAFCRHMLSSKEDAEDVLQEVFAAAFNAIQADNRALNVRPWLYRIARNRSLNHLRRVQPIGVDSMDVHFAEGGQTTADKVHRREEFRLLLVDVQHLPETQRTALLLREIDALSYDQIAEAMDTTVPSVKSLLVRARVGLAEAAEARQMSCDEVRLELGEVAEGLKRLTPPVRRHLKQCDRCSAFRKQLRDTNKALAAVFPVMLVTILAILMLQLQSFSKMAMVLLTAPLGLIGVVAALLIFQAPLGFVAILGVTALCGMIMRNAVILVDQVQAEMAEGRDPWNAVLEAAVHRTRPVALTAAATVLAMIPLTRSVFWGPMAIAIMGGLTVATVLTIFFVPALYAAWFRVERASAPNPPMPSAAAAPA